MSAYAELVAISNFSFLRGGSHPHELVVRAAGLGLSGLGLCDRNSLAGVVRAHVAMRDMAPSPAKFRFVAGARLVFDDGTPDIVTYPRDREAYGRLTALLTLGNRRAEKGSCALHFDDLAEFSGGQFFILMAEASDPGAEAYLQALKHLAPGRVWLAAACRYLGDDRARLNHAARLAQAAGVPMLASNDVIYHGAERRVVQDVLTAIREHVTIFEAGQRLEQNAERHLKPPEEMARLYRDHESALIETERLLEQIEFSLEDLRYEYPDEVVDSGETAQQTLERETWAGAKRRYPDGVPVKVQKGLRHELALIGEKLYAPYFLTVHDLVRFAREERGILCQGRGSAANSAVCFCLGVTEVDPMLIDLLFERFISTERNEPPDIDVDFEHERREEVIQYLYERYGRHRAGLTATVVTYRTKGAIREVGKVFGLSADLIEALQGAGWRRGGRSIDPEWVREAGLDPGDHTLRLVLGVVSELTGFPRHLSQHVGGFVITRDRLDHLVPISNAAMDGRTVVEWDKDDLDALGILKVDVLALGMLSAIRRAFELLGVHYDTHLTLASVPREEAGVYKMVQRADTIGAFQIESRAQMSMLPRLKPEKFYDLVVEVAIVRPGPIQGDMVHPYLRRRQGLEAVEYPKPELREVLEKTYGVPLFQEQAMKIAIVAGGFTPGEADQLRRAMATFKRTGTIGTFRDKMITGMLARGYERDFATRCFKQIEGFADYGFPESHAASFALLVYVSAWIKCHYPDVFAAALLNSQPMGFYAPSQIVRDACEHGVEVRAVDINLSDMETVLEEGRPAAGHLWDRHKEMAGDIRSTKAVRLGLHQVKGLRKEDGALIAVRRGRGYDSVRDVWLRTGLSPTVLERLAEADAFGSLGLNRRDALWAVSGLNGTDGAGTLPLFAGSGPPDPGREPDANLPPMPPGEEVIHDYRSLSLSLKAHPMSFLRRALDAAGMISAEQLRQTGNGRIIELAGLVLIRQRPGTASGVIFATLEDETGVANIIVWPKVFEANRRVVLGSRLLRVRGQVQKEGLVIHLIARELSDMTGALAALSEGGDPETEIAVTRRRAARQAPGNGGSSIRSGAAQAGMRPVKWKQLAKTHNALPGGRNFH